MVIVTKWLKLTIISYGNQRLWLRMIQNGWSTRSVGLVPASWRWLELVDNDGER